MLLSFNPSRVFEEIASHLILVEFDSEFQAAPLLRLLSLQLANRQVQELQEAWQLLLKKMKGRQAIGETIYDNAMEANGKDCGWLGVLSGNGTFFVAGGRGWAGGN